MATGGARGQVFAHRGPPLPNHAVDRSGEHRVGQGLARQLQLGPPLGQDRLPGADFLQRILIPCLGHLLGGHGGIELGAGHELLLGQAVHALAVQPRLVQDGAGLAHERGLLGVHPIVGPPRRQPQANAGLVKRGFGLLQAKLEIRGVEPGHDLTAAHGTAEVHRQFAQAAGHLQAENDLVIRGQRARHRHRPWHARLERGNDADLSGLGRRVLAGGGGRRGVLAAAGKQGEQQKKAGMARRLIVGRDGI